tara:strand:+ start:291 stop:1052 length:762 start_codon:yes stop_codon:yes gene_type:complete
MLSCIVKLIAVVGFSMNVKNTGGKMLNLHFKRSIFNLGMLLIFLITACASTGKGVGGDGPPPIGEGKGRLFLETAGINSVNFYVLDQETGEEVYSESPRVAANSPIGFESGYGSLPQYVDLAPGNYLVVVNTDVEDSVEKEIEVRMGQEVYATIPVGRFQLIFFEGQERSQMPFLIYDYNLRTVLGRGMTSTEVRYFIVPTGEYKVRIENLVGSGSDDIRPVQVRMGQTQNIIIGPPPSPGQIDETGENGDLQ